MHTRCIPNRRPSQGRGRAVYQNGQATTISNCLVADLVRGSGPHVGGRCGQKLDQLTGIRPRVIPRT